MYRPVVVQPPGPLPAPAVVHRGRGGVPPFVQGAVGSAITSRSAATRFHAGMAGPAFGMDPQAAPREADEDEEMRRAIAASRESFALERQRGAAATLAEEGEEDFDGGAAAFPVVPSWRRGAAASRSLLPIIGPMEDLTEGVAPPMGEEPLMCPLSGDEIAPRYAFTIGGTCYDARFFARACMGFAGPTNPFTTHPLTNEQVMSLCRILQIRVPQFNDLWVINAQQVDNELVRERQIAQEQFTNDPRYTHLRDRILARPAGVPPMAEEVQTLANIGNREINPSFSI